MPPIAAARSGQNIRRTCKLMSDISTSPTAATKAPSSAAACGSGKNVQAVSHPKNSKLYKTELCRTWMDCGRCNYGDKFFDFISSSQLQSKSSTNRAVMVVHKGLCLNGSFMQVVLE
ncbi:unnamed protein product [Litomosoides sigmodontis]|uniref:C3H1-type domain-containing protein n=1 Tax=Litomosoides sigmodontis TaxID=42156 RepID=A0A3P6UNN9_LITSI|nr:unnamed protein product [Litomosoides sigmodontis]